MTKRLAFIVVAWVPAAAGAGCALIDGISGSVGVTRDNVCRVTDELSVQFNDCTGGDAPFPLACATLECLVDNDGGCGTESDAFVACLGREHDCDSASGDAFCFQERESFAVCTGGFQQCGGACPPPGVCGDGFCCGQLGEDDGSCPQDCGGQLCPPNVCGDGCCSNSAGDDGGSCAQDCGEDLVCNFDGRCDDFEDPSACPDDCSGCNFDTICARTERDLECPEDCAGIACNRDLNCDGDESLLCGDCSAPCDDDPAACGFDGGCDQSNKLLCDVADEPNCRVDLPSEAGVCRPQCTGPDTCTGGEMCLRLDQEVAVCAFSRCTSVFECANGRCTEPYAMRLVDESGDQAGLCALDCDPIDCLDGGCVCPDTFGFFVHCATVRDAVGAAVGFGCVGRGDLFTDQPCTFEADCAIENTCHNGTCRRFCSVSGGGPPGAFCTGTCEPLLGDVGACVLP